MPGDKPELRECMSERKRRARSGASPHPVDVIAGRNLNIARKLAGYSQQRLGAEVGLTFQQIQKYENGKNRMSVSRAWEFASILGISFSALVDGADDMTTGSGMTGPRFTEWLTLYTRAQATGRLREIAAVAGHIVQLCELSAPESSQCQ
ncbi:helix-turn-helix domain-containing protein [Mesorhizobium sp. BR1-1-13]|uniref:helix-turn-helix domain-containing protein n=1 Tax=Mesorhizobium sp. BR1-1-13 TaxID=2876656 RepID=UPI001CD12958|nr:helix-turn-helix transcriptional regulator [Mesorhizobium sp. BR1-1-13]MBZ9944502.1 helix-turn-helix domain-containing protein [Mesorhizobium sp. BR1-1-13]